MLRPFLALFLVSTTAHAVAPPRPTGALVIVGGGGMPSDVERRFVELAGGKNARLIVLPTASASADAPDAEKSFLARWRKHDLASVQLLHTRQRAKANDPAFVQPLREATAVWISGGDQSRVTAAYRGTAVERELKRLLDRGGVIGGTSAGAAVMSEVMITGGRREASLGQGLGLLTGLVVDQHFLKRDRVDRLLGVLARHPTLVGVGIDEATAVVARGGKLEVLGDSYVMAIVLAGKVPTIRILSRGGKLDVEALRHEGKR